MNVGLANELTVVLGTIIFSLLILVLIDRLGTLRREDRDDEEEY